MTTTSQGSGTTNPSPPTKDKEESLSYVPYVRKILSKDTPQATSRGWRRPDGSVPSSD